MYIVCNNVTLESSMLHNRPFIITHKNNCLFLEYQYRILTFIDLRESGM